MYVLAYTAPPGSRHLLDLLIDRHTYITFTASDSRVMVSLVTKYRRRNLTTIININQMGKIWSKIRCYN